MNRMAWIAALALPLAAQTVDAVAHLERTRKMFQEEIAGLSEAQWKFKPAPERWSVAECAEHITESEDFLRGLAEKNAKASAGAETSQVPDAKVVATVTDRSAKFKAPEPLVPSGRFASREDVAREFDARRARTVELVRSHPEAELRKRVRPNPALGAVDAYQFFLFLSGHTERHILQMREVKADPGFPKK